MVREGALDQPGLRVLLLPRVEALTQAEAEAVRRFLARGGVVMADVRTGLYDGHCKPRAEGALDDLFGVRRQGSPAAVAGTSGEIGALRLDPGVAVTTGAPAYTVNGLPAFVSRVQGQGETLFLNADFSAFAQLASAETPERLATEMALLFARAKVIAEYTLVGRDRQRERRVMVSRWQNGDAALFSLFRTAGERSPVEVLLPREAAVYDLRRHRLVTTGRAFSTEVVPNRASFFAVLPVRAPEARVALSHEAAGPGDVVTATLSVPGARGLHALRLQVVADGEPADWFGRNVIVGQEPVAVPLPVAWNDPTGRYLVRAVDLFTGGAATASFVVR
jgi:hypothetical protein